MYAVNLSRTSRIDSSNYGQLNGFIVSMQDAWNNMERIRSTSIPVAYLIHMKQAITVYCLIVPFSMVDLIGYATIPLVMLVAFTLFGIDGIGVEIEDPFGTDLNDLNAERFCADMRDELFLMKDRIPTRLDTETALGLS